MVEDREGKKEEGRRKKKEEGRRKSYLRGWVTAPRWAPHNKESLVRGKVGGVGERYISKRGGRGGGMRTW